MVSGENIYTEILISVENNGKKIEYKIWNPFKSKLAASIIGGISETGICPGAKVLYLGGDSGRTVSHVSNIIGPEGIVYVVEFSNKAG